MVPLQEAASDKVGVDLGMDLLDMVVSVESFHVVSGIQIPELMPF